MTRNLPTPQAAASLGISTDTLRVWARGRTSRGETIPPVLSEGTCWFRRGSATSTMVFRLDQCREILSALGYRIKEEAS